MRSYRMDPDLREDIRIGDELIARAELVADERRERQANVFAQARSELPACCAGNFDPLSHKTLEDLGYVALHEVDMWEEGQETDIKSEAEARKVRAYIFKLSELIAAQKEVA